MKKFIAALLLLSAAMCVSAQQKENTINLKVKCYERDRVIDILNKEFKEKVLFVGIDQEHGVQGVSSFLTHNAETETFTMGFHLTNTNLICIISSGSGSQVKDK